MDFWFINIYEFNVRICMYIDVEEGSSIMRGYYG